jgi:hypothetical protein
MKTLGKSEVHLLSLPKHNQKMDFNFEEVIHISKRR